MSGKDNQRNDVEFGKLDRNHDEQTAAMELDAVIEQHSTLQPEIRRKNNPN